MARKRGLDLSRHRWPGAVYLRFESRSITWSQLQLRVTSVAAAMARRGVGAGDPPGMGLPGMGSAGRTFLPSLGHLSS
jgi:acyl-CoA synthetase (AMP-forming)/AMP-acid ligase II